MEKVSQVNGERAARPPLVIARKASWRGEDWRVYIPSFINFL